MEFKFGKEDIEAMAQRVAEIIKPMITYPAGSGEKDIIFDVKGLAGYLQVKESWIYQAVHTHSIPFFKVGKYPRFKQKEIDRWIDGQAVRTIPTLKVVKGRRVYP